MATFSATLTGVNNGAASSGTMPVARSVPDATATAITTSGSSQQASITASFPLRQYWVLTVSGGDVWVSFGSNPTAAASSGYFMAAGQTREFSVTGPSEKVAVING